MSTVIRPSISKKNEYYISKHRYYELKHFCLQYPEWKKEYRELYLEPRAYRTYKVKYESENDMTSDLAIRRQTIHRNMEMVEQAAIETDPDLFDYILMAVTNGMSYEYLKMNKDIPCSRDTFYNRYRRFFWLLDKSR